MQRCEIGESQFHVLDNWEEIPVYIARDLYKICKTKMPESITEKYDDLMKCKNEDEAKYVLIEWLEKNQNNDYSNFYSQVITCLSDTDALPDNINPDSLRTFYATYVEHIVIGILHNGIGYNNKRITEFEHKGVTYQLPKERKVFDLTISMEGITMLQFSEFSDLLKLISSQPDGFMFLPSAVAYLALPSSEVHDEEYVQEVAKEFLDLPMSTVWDVFFYTTSTSNIYKADLQTYLMELGEEAKIKPSVQWGGEGRLSTSVWTVEAFWMYPMSSN